jgi:hypothetical protein
MSLILAWVLFPLLLGVIGAAWGSLVERLAGESLDDALLLPVGLAAALVVAGTLGAFTGSAPLAAPVVAVGTLAGLPGAWAARQRLCGWHLAAAGTVLLFFGAPVILSGDATFAGYIKLDDTSVWLNIIDHLPTGPHAAGGELPSTYALEYNTGLGPHYPRGAFVLPAVAHDLTGIDAAWIFQPYLAACAAGVALCLYALVRPLVPGTKVRALIAFLAAQSALLYGYSLWGGIKELTAAFLLALVAALAAKAVRGRPGSWRALLPLAIAAGALAQTLGAGAAAWLGFLFLFIVVAWLVEGRRAGKLPASLASTVSLGMLTAACMVPVWISLNEFLASDSGLYSSGQTEQTKLGNLAGPLSGFQLAGIWPRGDFREHLTGLPGKILIGVALLAAAWALLVGLRRRQWALWVYAAAALGGCALIYKAGATPWVVGKTLAIASPALPVTALVGAAMLLRRRGAGIVVFAALAFGVLWSNALAYHDVVLAPRDRLAELQHIGTLVDGKPLTLINEYEIYGTYHFLREGAPVGPADYRDIVLALRDGTSLTKTAWADLDSFPLATLENHRSIVTRRSPAESRPPSNYELVWQGRYYNLWQRPESPDRSVLVHVPLGESTRLPYCGAAQSLGETVQPECSANPVATPPCERIRGLARRAGALGGDLVAHQNAAPVVARADETLWPAPWLHDPEGRTLTPNDPGRLVSHIGVLSSQVYELWLGGSFARGFQVAVNGTEVGTAKNELSNIGGYVHIADVELEAGTHKVTLTYPDADLTPGSGNNSYTSLTAIVLQPTKPKSRLITVPPEQAEKLCGRPLDWVEIVTPAS